MNTRRRRRRDEWCNLPKDLLTTIGERLGTRMDVLRLRAVCTSWRSSIPLVPNNNNSPSFPITLPHPIFTGNRSCLTESTIYRLELPPPDQEGDDNNSNSSESSSSSTKGWLVMVREWSKPGHFRLLNPLSHCEIRYDPETFPKKIWNLLDYRVFEQGKAYSLEYFIRNCRLVIEKAIYSADESAVLISDLGKLEFLRLGDEKWTRLAPCHHHFSDIILYNGKFHAFDKWDQVVVIDSSTLKRTKVWHPPVKGFGGKFLQSSGDLYLIRENVRKPSDDEDNGVDYFSKYQSSASFLIYKLHEAAGWVKVKFLNDRVAFVGRDYSFLALDEQVA